MHKVFYVSLICVKLEFDHVLMCTVVCNQGIRSENVGVIDDEYVVHLGIPTSRVSD